MDTVFMPLGRVGAGPVGLDVGRALRDHIMRGRTVLPPGGYLSSHASPQARPRGPGRGGQADQRVPRYPQ